MSDADDLLRLLARDDLPASFERWSVALAAGTERPTSGDEWAGAIVLVQSGRLEVDCLAGGRRVFEAGDVIILGWLPLRLLRNAGAGEVRLVAVRRAGHRPATGFLRVVRGLAAARAGDARR